MIGFDRLPRWPPCTAATLYTAIAAFVVFMAFIACVGQAAQAVAAELPTPPSLPPYTVPEAVAQRFATPATRSDTPGLQPGRSSYTINEELRAVLHELAVRAGGPRLLAAGQSTAGVAIEALHCTRGPGRPVVLLVGQQHGDEPAGAEALLAVARLLGTPAWAPLLDRIDVVVLPRANPDGAALGLRWSRSQGLRNGIGLQLETRGLGLDRNHLERRVHSHVVAVNSLLQSAARVLAVPRGPP